jgi:hypothetical protein
VNERAQQNRHCERREAIHIVNEINNLMARRRALPSSEERVQGEAKAALDFFIHKGWPRPV